MVQLVHGGSGAVTGIKKLADGKYEVQMYFGYFVFPTFWQAFAFKYLGVRF